VLDKDLMGIGVRLGALEVRHRLKDLELARREAQEDLLVSGF
jgi:hypothetical protein